MALELTDQQRAPLTILLHYSDGSTADPGDQFHFAFTDAAVAQITGGPGGWFVGSLSAGSTTLTLEDMARTVSTSLDIVVTASPPPVSVDGIEAVPGAPEPK